MTLTRALGVVPVAGVLALTGCFATPQAQLDFSDTEQARITEIKVTGGSGDVAIRTAARTDTAINRVVRYRGGEPGRTYRIEGSVLTVETRCGGDCGVTYDIEAPAGVKVTGALQSGDIRLTGVGAVDVQVTSGDVTVDNATGPVTVRTTSGDVVASAVTGAATLTATSGDIEARALSGPATARTTSGTIDLHLVKAAAVQARANNGDVQVTVPPGRYQVRVDTDNGDQNVTVANDAAAPTLLDVATDNGDVTVREG